MAGVQSTEDMLRVLNHLVGESVAEFQVLGVNSLKSVRPSPDDLAGARITGVSAAERILTLRIGAFITSVDLQRTGRVQWLVTAEPARIGHTSLPTARLILQSGSGLDFTEPAKTKRISVTINAA